MKLFELLNLLTPAGQQQLVDFVREANATQGKPFADYVREHYPQFVGVLDVLINYTPRAAVNKLIDDYPLLPIRNFAPQIIALHETLNRELKKTHEQHHQN